MSPVDIADSLIPRGTHQLFRFFCHGFFSPFLKQKITLSAASETAVTIICQLIYNGCRVDNAVHSVYFLCNKKKK